MKSCNCSEKSPMLNCGLHLDKGHMFASQYSPVYTKISLNHHHTNIQRYRPILCISRNQSKLINIKNNYTISIGLSNKFPNKSIKMSRYINQMVRNDLKLTDILILIDINTTNDFHKFHLSTAVLLDERINNVSYTIIKFDNDNRFNDIIVNATNTFNQFIDLVDLNSSVNTILLEYQTSIQSQTTINIGIIVFNPNSLTLKNMTIMDDHLFIMKELTREIQDKSICLYEINVNFIILVILDTYKAIIYNSFLYNLHTYINMAVFISNDYLNEVHDNCIYNSYNNTTINQQYDNIPPILLLSNYSNTNYNIISMFRNNDIYKLQHDVIKI